MAAIAPHSAGEETRAPVQSRRLTTMIVVGLFISTFVSDSRLAKLPLQFLLKDHLHVEPTAMAAFFGLTSLAWYFKPLAGLLSDVVPLGGSRRRNYLILSGFGAGAMWALLPLVPRQYGPLVWILVVANVFAVLASSVSGGLLVQAGQRMGRTGRMGALRETIIAGTFLLAQPIGGYLVSRSFGLTCGIGAVLFLSLVPAAILLLSSEKRIARPAVGYGREIKARLAPVFRARALWLAAAFIFLKNVSPGFGTPLFYFQTNTLKFGPHFLGWLGALSYGTAILGALIYGWLCTRFPLSRLLVIGIILSALSALLFLGYHSSTSALIIQSLAGQGTSGLLGIIVDVALMDLAARATPRGGEAMAYSLLMSAANLGGTGSDILGSWLFDKMHVAFHVLVWISAATTALALLALPLLPRSVLEGADRSRHQRPDSRKEEASTSHL